MTDRHFDLWPVILGLLNVIWSLGSCSTAKCLSSEASTSLLHQVSQPLPIQTTRIPGDSLFVKRVTNTAGNVTRKASATKHSFRSVSDDHFPILPAELGVSFHESESTL